MKREKMIELLGIARQSIGDAFKGIPVQDYPDDEERCGAFVTLRKGGMLRGCIGYLSGLSTLKHQIALLARDAAFSDYRFPPLSEEELQSCTIEISVLTEPEEIQGIDEFIPGRDGIILSCDGRRAVFLPQVAEETGWTKEEMLSALAEKAGLRGDAWRNPDASFMTFKAEIISEDDM